MLKKCDTKQLRIVCSLLISVVLALASKPMVIIRIVQENRTVTIVQVFQACVKTNYLNFRVFICLFPTEFELFLIFPDFL